MTVPSSGDPHLVPTRYSNPPLRAQSWGMNTRPTADLLDEIVRSLGPMPVRLMEEAIRRGDEAASAAVALLEDLLPGVLAGDRKREPIWLEIVLGELRWPGAIPPLLRVLEESGTDVIGLPGAAVDALAKIGPEAVDGLVGLLDNAPAHRRIRVYSALGGMDDPRARERLDAALRGDPELAPLLATASDEDGGWTPAPDFRLRYRPVPWLGIPEPGWVGWAVLEHELGRALPRSHVPDRPFPRVLPTPPPNCSCCHVPVWREVGTLVCPATVVFAPAAFHRALAEAEEHDGFHDMFEVLEAIEAAAQRLVLEPPPRGKMALADWTARLAEMCDLWAACTWLIEQGIEDVAGARERMLDELYLLGGIHGDPKGMVAWSEHGPSRRPPVWRRAGRVRRRQRKA